MTGTGDVVVYTLHTIAYTTILLYNTHLGDTVVHEYRPAGAVVRGGEEAGRSVRGNLDLDHEHWRHEGVVCINIDRGTGVRIGKLKSAAAMIGAQLCTIIIQ